MSDLTDFINKWQNDLEFQVKYKANPQEALDEANIHLDSDELKMAQMILDQKKFEDEELNKRISK